MLFRENRAFGTGGVARGVAPLPATFFGAFRTAYLKRHAIDFRRYADPSVDDQEVRGGVWPAIGSPEAAGRVRFKGPFPVVGRSWLFPSPANLSALGEISQPPDSEPVEDMTDLSGLGLRTLQARAFGAEPNEARWLPESALVAYLLDAVRDEPQVTVHLRAGPAGDSVPSSQLFVTETRYGHMRNPVTSRPEDQRLFSLEMLRPVERVTDRGYSVAGWGAVVDHIVAAELPTGSVLLGGRSRRCDLYHATSAPNFDSIRELVTNAARKRRRCLLYLATPAIFRAGWCPSPLPGLTLVAAALGPLGVVGGWDLAKRRPRPSRKIAPAGSVYFYEGEPTEGWPAFVDRLHFESLSDERPEAGFGIGLVGAW